MEAETRQVHGRTSVPFSVVLTEDVATCTGAQEKVCDHKKETTHSHFPGAKNEVPEGAQVY